MSAVGPFSSDGPLGDLMRNLARLLSTQGPVNWEIAQELAGWTATGGEAEPNPDPLARVRLEELLRVAELQVGETTGLATSQRGILTVRAVGRRDWAVRTLDAWRPLFERMATAAADAAGHPVPETAASADPMAQLLGNLPQALGPLLFGMQAGSMVGQLAGRAMGQYDLPMPRPPSDELLMVPATIDQFSADWSLPADDTRLWVCVRETAMHAVIGRPHVRARLDELIAAWVGAFRPDPRALEDRLGGVDPTDLSALQSLFEDPEAMLGELQTDEQRSLQVPLGALLSTISGWVDHVVETVGRRLIGSYGPLTEALHRRRLEDDGGARILGRLFGVALDAADYERGAAFVVGVLERAGPDGLARLWRSPSELPTPAELDAPGLWLARIDLPAEG
jgi:putative hydrolase